ncbi:MurR/RpiR family transcriptional regulator [Streptococcus dentiloxodontae]
MDILQKMKRQEENFSKTEKKVYLFIKNNLERIETITISKLAAECKTSTSAVLRFCQILGYKGYKDFRYDVIDYLHKSYQKPSEDIWDHMVDEYTVIMNQLKSINRTSIEQLIQDIRLSSHLHIFGIHLSSLPARQLHYGLQDLEIISNIATDLNSGAHLTNIIAEEDTFIMFSLSGSLSNFNSSLSAISKNMPEKSYLVTLNSHAQSKKYFKQVITLPGNSFSKESIIDLQSIPTLFVELLLNLLHSEL